MNEVINVLNQIDKEYEIGIINNGYFFCLETPFEEKKVIKIKWKKESIKSLMNKFNKNNINMKLIADNNFYGRFQINNSDNELLVEYVVNSHVQLPRLLLKSFTTGDRLYYIKTDTNEIIESSAATYNTKYGYYSKWFEDYLSKNYESIISKLIRKIEPFANKSVKEIEIEDLYDQINKLFFMALFRNPDEVKKINDNSLSARFIKGGIISEDIALTCEDMSKNLLKNYRPLVVINELTESLLTIKCLFSNLSLKDANCIFLPLHPKFGIAMVPNEYFNNLIKEYGNKTYIVINNYNTLEKINLNIYHSALINKTDVIGKKDDLERLLLQINNS